MKPLIVEACCSKAHERAAPVDNSFRLGSSASLGGKLKKMELMTPQNASSAKHQKLAHGTVVSSSSPRGDSDQAIHLIHEGG